MTTLDRRQLLVRGAAGLATTGLATGLGSTLAWDRAYAARSPFLHGVASGDPLPDGVVLWTRVTPSREATPGSGNVFAASLAKGEMHPLAKPFSIDRFYTGALIDEHGAAAVAH